MSDSSAEPAPVDFPPAPDAADITQLSYEQARDELVEVVRQLEAGGATLAESLTLWERGEALSARCQAWLDGAKARFEQVTQEADAS